MPRPRLLTISGVQLYPGSQATPLLDKTRSIRQSPSHNGLFQNAWCFDTPAPIEPKRIFTQMEIVSYAIKFSNASESDLIPFLESKWLLFYQMFVDQSSEAPYRKFHLFYQSLGKATETFLDEGKPLVERMGRKKKEKADFFSKYSVIGGFFGPHTSKRTWFLTASSLTSRSCTTAHSSTNRVSSSSLLRLPFVRCTWNSSLSLISLLSYECALLSKNHPSHCILPSHRNLHFLPVQEPRTSIDLLFFHPHEAQIEAIP